MSVNLMENVLTENDQYLLPLKLHVYGAEATNYMYLL